MYYLQSRYYNPEWGRFINSDGLLESGHEVLENNLYAYCSNNPINYYDSNGELSCTLIPNFILTVAIIIGVVYIATNIIDIGFDIANTIVNSTSLDSNSKSEKDNNKESVGSATKMDIYHSFPDIVDNYEGYAEKFLIKNDGILYQVKDFFMVV